MSDILQVFKECLPKKPYCTNNFKFGIDPRAHNSALKKSYIQPNRPDRKDWIIIDGDYPGAGHYWKSLCDIPAPNFVAENKTNGHAHLFYKLRTPVKTKQDETTSQKAINYFNRIKDGLNYNLDGDFTYTGLIAKNPFSDKWSITTYSDTPYDLEELITPIDYDIMPPSRDQFKLLDNSYRNCSAFDVARIWAYKAVNKHDSYESFYSAVYEYTNTLNDSFDKPLNDGDIKAISKSISSWTWNKNTGLPKEVFSAIQKKRNLISQKTRKAKAEENEKAILSLMLARPGLTKQEVADLCGCSRATVYRAIKSGDTGEAKNFSGKVSHLPYSDNSPSDSTKGPILLNPLSTQKRGQGDYLFSPPFYSEKGAGGLPFSQTPKNYQILEQIYSLESVQMRVCLPAGGLPPKRPGDAVGGGCCPQETRGVLVSNINKEDSS